jgi:hypothetical protein
MNWLRRPLRFKPVRSHPGQALVEMALSITVLALLLAAATDLGLAFKNYQTLVNATAEASSYLEHFPRANCEVNACPNGNAIEGANIIARQRFQFEQGATPRRLGSTLDLDANGVPDTTQEGFDITQWIQISEADNTQVDDLSDYDPSATALECRQRNPNPTSVSSCYIVVQTQMLYRPFFLRPILGEQMTIRTTSIRKIVLS